MTKVLFATLSCLALVFTQAVAFKLNNNNPLTDLLTTFRENHLAIAEQISRQVSSVSDEEGLVPTPGNIAASFDVANLDLALNELMGAVCKYAHFNKTIDVGFSKHLEKGKSHADFNLDTIDSLDITGCDDNQLSFMPGNDTLLLEIGNLNFEIGLTGDFSGKKSLIKASGTMERIVLTNLTLQLQFNAETDDNGVNWVASGIANGTLQDFELHGTLKSLSKAIITAAYKAEKDNLVNFLSNFIGKFADQVYQYGLVKLNEQLTPENSEWHVGILTPLYPMNMTMTKAPLFDYTQDIIEVHFDGRFIDTAHPENVGVLNSEWQTRLDSSDSNYEPHELFVNQATADQVVSFLYNKKAPLRVGSPNLSDTIASMMPELKMKYGFGVQIAIDVQLADDGEGQNALTLDSTKGIVLGSIDGEAIPLQLSFLCSNDEVTDELAMVLDASIMVAIELAVKDYVVSVQVGDYNVANGSVQEDNIGLWDRDYTKLLYDIMTTFITDFNVKRHNPIDLTSNKIVALVAEEFISSIVVSPFVLDENLFAGIELGEQQDQQ